MSRRARQQLRRARAVVGRQLFGVMLHLVASSQPVLELAADVAHVFPSVVLCVLWRGSSDILAASVSGGLSPSVKAEAMHSHETTSVYICFTKHGL